MGGFQEHTLGCRCTGCCVPWIGRRRVQGGCIGHGSQPYYTHPTVWFGAPYVLQIDLSANPSKREAMLAGSDNNTKLPQLHVNGQVKAGSICPALHTHAEHALHARYLPAVSTADAEVWRVARSRMPSDKTTQLTDMCVYVCSCMCVLCAVPWRCRCGAGAGRLWAIDCSACRTADHTVTAAPAQPLRSTTQHSTAPQPSAGPAELHNLSLTAASVGSVATQHQVLSVSCVAQHTLSCTVSQRTLWAS